MTARTMTQNRTFDPVTGESTWLGKDLQASDAAVAA